MSKTYQSTAEYVYIVFLAIRNDADYKFLHIVKLT